MITIEEGIVYRLKNYSGLSALVGDRIYPLKLPQGVILPAVTYQRISTPRVITHDQGTGGLAMPRFQFSAYDDGYSSVKAVIKQIREALNGYKGTPGGTDTVLVHGAFAEDEQDFDDPDSGLYWSTIDFFIYHQE
jgi:hypothetical protein